MLLQPKKLQLSWERRFQHLFHPTVQLRGRRYFMQGRVDLQAATGTDIDCYVYGTREYDVSLTDASGRGKHIKAYCDCPHFQSGNYCKHLWAAMLAADRQLRQYGPLGDAEEESSPENPPRNDAWKTLLFPGKALRDDKPNPWEGVPGHFMLRYEITLENDRVLLSALKNRVNKNGKLGRQITGADAQLLQERNLPQADRAILEGLQALYLKTTSGQWYGRTFFPGRRYENYVLDASSLKAMLPQLAATGRCRVYEGGALRVDPLRPGEPFEGTVDFELTDETAAEDNALVYRPIIRFDKKTVPLELIALFFYTEPVHFIYNNCLHALAGADSDWVRDIRRIGCRISVPQTEIKEFYQELETQKAPSSLEVPDHLAPAIQNSITPSPCLEVEFAAHEVTATLLLDYAGAEIAYGDQRQWILDVDAWQRIARQPECERAFVKRILDSGFELRGENFFPVGTDGLDALDRLLDTVDDDWQMRSRDKHPIKRGKVSTLRVSSGKDWFDLEGELEFGEDVIIPLPQAIRAYLRGERQMLLPNGETGLLPAGWLAQNARTLQLGDSGRAKETHLQFHSAHALLLDSLLEAVEETQLDADFLSLRKRIREFSGVAVQNAPEGFCGELRPYQREGLGWLEFLSRFGFGGVLADDMGLGKTVQVLAWLLSMRQKEHGGPSLVVAPTSLLFNWRDEAARFTPELRVLNYAGLGRKKLAANFADYDLVLTTYGVLRRDVELLREVAWQSAILDESQAIKNPDSQTAKAARLLRARHRLCMTGTPLENRLDELWSQFQFINPNMLGSRKTFDNRFAKPIAQADESSRDLLLRTIKPFLLRRTKSAVAKELPEKQESALFCEMSPAQAKLYAKLRDHYRSEILASVDSVGLNRSKVKVLEGLLRLRQAACHPALVGDGKTGSGKLEECVRLLREVLGEGHKVLIFSQFTKFLKIIRERLDKEGITYLYLDGHTSPKQRAERVAAFQKNSGPPVFCISLKAGGVGLNLTAADYVFIMDPWWNPAVEAQAVDRTHRIGQQKKVFAYRLICTDSIDEKVLRLQQDKRELAEILDQGATSSVASLTREDLNVLFS